LKNILLTINQKKITLNVFMSYVLTKQNLPTDVLFNSFVDAQILTYFKENLVNTNLDFADTLAEYEDGLLLFELMQQKIWNKSMDTIALKNYFESHKNNYDVKELESIKGKVMNDYQISLDEKWINSLRSNNIIKIDKKVLKSLIKYYRKES